MDVKAVDFIQYAVSDLNSSLEFYGEVLGLPLESHIESIGWAEFALPPTTLALYEVDEADEPTPGPGGASMALAVEDVASAVDELRAEGGSVLVEPFDTSVCDIATVADPDGNPILLHHRHDGTFGRQDPFPDELQ